METQTPLSSQSTIARGRRLALSLPATGVGWLATTLATLPFEWVELVRNAAPRSMAWQVTEGTLLWSVFTLAVCAVLWCVVVLPMALLAPASWVLRCRHLLAFGFPLLAVLLIGWRLEVWRDLVWEKGGENPLTHTVLWEYWLFGTTLALGTTLAYLSLLRRSISGGLRSRQATIRPD